MSSRESKKSIKLKENNIQSLIIKNIKINHVNALEIGNYEDGSKYLNVRFTMPVAESETHTFAFHMEIPIDKLPQEMKDTLSKLLKQSIIHYKHLSTTSIDSDVCDTCIGSCCYIFSDKIYVTQEDVDRISEDKEPGFIKKHFDWLDKPEPFGEIAKTKQILIKKSDPLFKYAKDDGDKEPKVCIFFENGKCSIHDVKPAVCLNYNELECDLHEENKENTKQKTRLKVV